MENNTTGSPSHATFQSGIYHSNTCNPLVPDRHLFLGNLFHYLRGFFAIWLPSQDAARLPRLDHPVPCVLRGRQGHHISLPC